MPVPALTAVTRSQGNHAALKDGRVSPRTCTLAFEDVPVLIHAFRRMVRELAYDVCEMALTTYLCAREHGVRFTALPVFLVRGFHHGAIKVNRKAGIRDPKDLEGRRVGVNRGYTVTTGVWARAVLAEHHGVDLDRITWVLSGDEHVASYRPPANVVPIEPGLDMAEELASGRLDAAIGIDVDHRDVVPLFPDAGERGLALLKAHGHYPINHLVVVRDEVLADHPGLARDLFDAFARAKTLYMEALRAGTIDKPTAADRLHASVLAAGRDPLPYGIEPNRRVLESLIGHAHRQGILQRPDRVEDVFAAETRDLSA